MNIEEKVAKAWYLAQYLRLLEKRLIEKKCHTSNDSQAFKQLFDLVERDTPKRTYQDTDSGGTDHERCSSCNASICLWDERKDYHDEFCWKCGKRLDRREE